MEPLSLQMMPSTNGFLKIGDQSRWEHSFFGSTTSETKPIQHKKGAGSPTSPSKQGTLIWACQTHRGPRTLQLASLFCHHDQSHPRSGLKGNNHDPSPKRNPPATPLPAGHAGGGRGGAAGRHGGVPLPPAPRAQSAGPSSRRDLSSKRSCSKWIPCLPSIC